MTPEEVVREALNGWTCSRPVRHVRRRRGEAIAALNTLIAERDRLNRLVETEARINDDLTETNVALMARLNEARKREQQVEAVLVAADRVREAYEAMLEGRDIGSLPVWSGSSGRASISDTEGDDR